MLSKKSQDKIDKVIFLKTGNLKISLLSIILIEPKTAGNIGAIARVMANFNCENLILINPKCNHLSKEALDRATHAKNILEKAKIADFSVFKEFDYLIGTTAKIGTDYNLNRSPLSTEALAVKLSKSSKFKIGIVFGREDSGMKNYEIERCDFIVTIPTSAKNSTMNLSHSVAIVLYEIFKKSNEKKTGENITPISAKEKDIILKKINEILDKMQFSTKEKKETQRILWKRIIGKAMLTKREAFALLGFLKKMK